MHQYGELDDFRRCFEVAKRVIGYIRRLFTRIDQLKPGSADNADWSAFS
jgi:hypothetical protein